MTKYISVKFLIILTLLCFANIGHAKECVVLLHGLAKTSKSMLVMEFALRKDDYIVVNKSYPSRKFDIEALSTRTVPAAVDACQKQNATRIHFVTHSLGGILVRQYLNHHTIANLGKVVMLGPPNGGSELIDKLAENQSIAMILGPAGLQLSSTEFGRPNQLGAVDFTLGVIAGDKSINPLLSLMLPEKDDGKVTVENTKVEGMKDFIVLPTTHVFMMNRPAVIRQTKHFLRHARFKHS